jgi:hypothetical protein
MMPKKSTKPGAGKYPGEDQKLKRESSAERAKVSDMARRPMKKGKLTKGSRRRA